MRIHFMFHVPFEGPGSMSDFFNDSRFSVTATKLYQGEIPPETDSFDLLIIMGGPMGVHDAGEYPWLKDEIEFINRSVRDSKYILGICLGAQLIAHALGADVRKNLHKEIGWFPLTLSDKIRDTFLNDIFHDGAEVFHWHGETFDIPEGAIEIASSEACMNQGFVYNNRIIGLQFHLETTEDSASMLLENCLEDIDGSDFTQAPALIMEDGEKFRNINMMMSLLLQSIVEKMEEESI